MNIKRLYITGFMKCTILNSLKGQLDNSYLLEVHFQMANLHRIGRQIYYIVELWHFNKSYST